LGKAHLNELIMDNRGLLPRQDFEIDSQSTRSSLATEVCLHHPRILQQISGRVV
jgi:hypothetical protein